MKLNTEIKQELDEILIKIKEAEKEFEEKMKKIEEKERKYA